MTDTHSRRQFLQRAVLGAAALSFGVAAKPSAAFADGTPAALAPDRVFEGDLVAVRGSTLVVQTANGERQVTAAPGLSAWRGQNTSLDSLTQGADTLVRLDDSGAADGVWIDLDRVVGEIRDRAGDAYEVQLRDGTTREVSLAGDLVSGRAIPVGWTVDVIGTHAGNDLRGSRLVVATAPNTDSPGGFQPLDYVYEGHATWFNCSTGAGRCGTCNTGRNNQIAWPALDTCGACSSSCCDCSRTCVNQVHLSCGRGNIDVRDLDNNRLAQGLVIVDCGPNQNSLCGGSCGRRVVDLTRPTFTRFANPTVGCFAARARVNT
jgi:hypothetical protein